MYLELKHLKLRKANHGHDIAVKMVVLREDDGTYVKNLKINEETMRLVMSGRIHLKREKRKRIKR